jgi:hypothetical protein
LSSLLRPAPGLCRALYVVVALLVPPALQARSEFVGEVRGLVFEPTTDTVGARSNRSAEAELRFRGIYDAWRVGLEVDSGMSRAENGGREHWAVREAFVERRSGNFSILLGRKLESWGISEFFSPTDVLAPRNLARHRTIEKQRNLGVDQLGVTADVGDSTTLRAILMPYRESAVLPYAMTEALAAYGGGTQIAYPDRSNGLQGALRAQHHSEGVDASLLVFEGDEQLPMFTPATDGRLRGGLPRQRVVGGDLVVAAAGLLWQMEAAWWRSEAFCGSVSRCGSDDSQHLVLGIEKQMAGDSYLTAQWWQRWTHYAERPEPNAWSADLARLARNEFDSRLNVFFVNWSTRFWQDRASWDIGVGVDATQGSRFMRARLDASVDDHWKVRVKGEYFQGEGREIFNLLRYDSGVTIELAYLFNEW